MNESDVWRAIIAVLRTGLNDQGLNDVLVQQAYQPIKQGVTSGRGVYLHKITNKRIGHQGRKYTYNSVNGNFDVLEKSWRGSTIQLTVHADQDITDENSLTAYDITDTCSMILQSMKAIKELKTYDLSTERITDINQTFPLDDKDQFELDPSFDFKLLYEKTLSSTVPKIDTFEEDIKRV